MTLNMTTFDAALKVHYTDDRVKNLVYKNNPLLAMIPKMESFGGKNLPIPVQFGVPGSRSASFANALTQKTGASSRFDDFVLTRVKDYCLASIDNETLEASVGNANAFMEAAATEINSAILATTRSLATALYRDGSGVIGTGGAFGAGPLGPEQFGLDIPANIVNFEVGMTIDFELVAGPAMAGLAAVITAIDRDDGVITMTAGTGAAWGGAGWGNALLSTDRVACQGDYNAKLSGLSGWIPPAAPGAAAFFSVDRSVDTSRLGGVRFDATPAANKVEALTSASARLAREGGRPTHVFMNHEDYGELLDELNQKVTYAEVESYDRGDISFSGCRLHTPTGVITVIPDHNCPTTVAYLLQMDTWKLYSLGAAPKILQTDGLRFLREASADGVEVRVGYYAQLGCSAPGWNCVVTAF
jgi:hypothetical protein